MAGDEVADALAQAWATTNATIDLLAQVWDGRTKDAGALPKLGQIAPQLSAY